MKIISLGGVGGCIITQGLDCAGLYEPRGPYSWLIASQSFVIDTFLHPNNFFDFDDETQYMEHENKTVHLRHKNRNAVIIHDFETDINIELVKSKYNRRFQRLNDNLINNEPVLLIRVTEQNKQQLPEWENYYNVERDNFQKWCEFRKYLEEQFNKPFFLLIITFNKTEYEENIKYQSDKVLINYLSQENNNLNIENIANIFLETYHNLTS